ncbi:insulinase family protein [Clostridium tagluense]|uniref:insulinase family protein n=1 Tax=Clostridium tagluense TaxID=360422 RepID=UPI001C0BADF8|nr:insulinase family protein [Clostridium tagluense]MBU3129378.1 insulinase family protein [Clostridium tagluense]MCB2310719.1 insulinase family protein [Clostridium tagluense]MCB2315551.1 insulinase family protein [Clostridium tagluense]MCB2320405.1 insulinase family protein [Clostridium tagluense]MCB2325312.1 insulinase family protein [Clostridium tagluense]
MKKFTKITSILLTAGLLINSFSGVARGAQVKSVTAISVKQGLEIGKSTSGFKLESKKWIEDIQSTAMIFKHVKSGAKLIYLQNEDENKVFSINFRTPVNDNTGVNHIIEHSVLCGSEKYPVKDPFLTMAKQSLNTYINALTGTDFTMYPVASKNEKDFNNLMSVYLDAVFYPNITKDPRILKQEGWHYEVNSKTGELNYNGIVYNEMKGNYSSPQIILSNAINGSLFTDNSYSYESGGNPDNIPDLTYNKFIETYKKYYVPSNSSIYLYGKLDIENTLKFMDDNYLSKLKKTTVDSVIKLQKPYERKVEKTELYPVAKDADIKNMTYLSSNYMMNKVKGVEEVLGFQILQGILLNAEASPLKKALVDGGIGTNVYGSFNPSTQQPIFSIFASNANETDKYKFENIIDDTLKKIVKDGFDEELVNSVFTAVEFGLHTQNSDANRGMNYMANAMNSWNYDMSPTEYLEITPALNLIKSKISQGYFEKLIQKNLLDNNHKSLVVLKPSNGLNEKKEQSLKNKLAEYKASLSEIELTKIKKDTQELKKWQDTEDSKENSSKLPTLSRKDLNSKAEEIPTIEKLEGDIKVLSHPMFTDGITYSNIYFDSSKVPQDQILYLKLLANVLGNVSTEKYDIMQLSNKMMKDTGGISFNSIAFKNDTNTNGYAPKMIVSVNAMNSTLPKAYELLDEIMNHSKFDDKKRMKDLIKMVRTNYESMFVNGGNSLAMERTLSYLSDSGKYSDLGYLPYYDFICDLDDNFDAKFEKMVKNLNSVSDIVFNKEGLVVSYTGDEKNYAKFTDSLNSLGKKIEDKKFPRQEYKFDFSKKNEAFVIPSQVQYVVKAGSLKSAGYKYNGKMKVIENILNSDYLWKELRVKGGAYGGAMNFTKEDVLFYSYRDPNLKETLNTFDEAVKFLRNFKADEKEMTNYIIGTIGSMDGLTGPHDKGAIGDNMYFSGTTKEEVQKLRDEALSTTQEDIKNFANVLEAVIKQNLYCVVGSESKVNANSDLFDRIIVPIKNSK